jgi:hypothetical protein
MNILKAFIHPSKRKTVSWLRILYPVWTVIAMASLMYVPAAVLVEGDAALTARQLLSNELLYHLSIAGSLLTQLIHIIMVCLFWQLFKTVDRNLAGLFLIFGLVSVPIAMLNVSYLFSAHWVLSSPEVLNSFSAEQVEAWMMFFLNLNDKGLLIAQIFWGLWLLPIASLIYKSGYFHKITGHFLVIAALGYVMASFGNIIYPTARSSMIFTIFTIMSMGEILFMLWVVIAGARLPNEIANT